MSNTYIHDHENHIPTDFLIKIRQYVKVIIMRKYNDIKPEQIDSISDSAFYDIIINAAKYSNNTTGVKAVVFSMLVGADDFLKKGFQPDGFLSLIADSVVERITNDESTTVEV